MTKMEEKSIIERIISLRKGFSGGRGRKKFASLLGLSPSTYSYYEKDRIPPVPILLKICELCGVDINWLLTGKNDEKTGEKNKISNKNSQILSKTRKILENQPVSSEAISAFLNLLEEKAGLEERVKVQSSGETKTGTGWIPILGRTAAGVPGFWEQTIGTDSKIIETQIEELVHRNLNTSIINSIAADISIDSQAKPLIRALNSIGNVQANLIQTIGDSDNEVVEFVDCSQIQTLLPDCFALRVDGDSMSPRINDGDVVIVSPSISAAQGLPAVIRISGAIGVTCKLMSMNNELTHLVPINEKYDTKIVKKKDILWALAVICHIKLKNVNS